MKGLFI
jgi:hypothetical protein